MRRLFGAPSELVFRDWMGERTIAKAGGPERIADLIGIFDDPQCSSETFVVFEVQNGHDPKKLTTTALEAVVLRVEDEKQEREPRVLTALIYLRGRCPRNQLDMTYRGFGTLHTAAVWNVADEDAERTLGAIADESESTAMLHWVALMKGAERVEIIDRWKELITQLVLDGKRREQVAEANWVFSELAGCGREWKRALEEYNVTESKIMNEWIDKAKLKTRQEERRENLLTFLDGRFPGSLTEALIGFVNQQDDLDLLKYWMTKAADAKSFDDFMTIIRQ